MAKRYNRTKSGSIILPSGEKITTKEQAAFKSAISGANKKSKQYLSELTPDKRDEFLQFGRQSNWVYQKKKSSFHQFQNKEEFKEALRIAKSVSSGSAQKFRRYNYKTNYTIKAREVFGSKADRIKDKLNSMTVDEFAKLSEGTDLVEMNEFYKPEDADKYRKKLEAQLGLVDDDGKVILTKQEQKLLAKGKIAISKNGKEIIKLR